MIYSNLIRTAMTLAFMAHDDAKDKGGYPYFAHVLHVAEQMETEYETAVALLHDVIEDCYEGDFVYELEHANLPEEVLSAVFALTKAPDELYDEYIDRLSCNSIAVKVKLADLKHNCDLSRLKNVTQADFDRRAKYTRYIIKLNQINVSRL